MAALNTDATAAVRASVVVLFAETRGFTRTSEMLEAAVVFARVCEFFVLTTAAVERHQGVVRNLLNDTLMATFEGADNAAHALQAARDIQRDFAVLEEAWEREYGMRVSVAMGLHTGDAVIGVAGASTPGLALVIGDTVSVAERLVHRARPSEFVLSKNVMDAVLASGTAIDGAEELLPLVMARREPLPTFGVMRDEQLDFT